MVSETPGLKSRIRKDGTTAHYWVATAVSRDIKDFPQKTVRIHGDAEELASRCRILTSELREWLSGRTPDETPAYDGTLRSVIRLYQRTPESPYNDLKHNSRIMYDESLKLLETTVGARQLSKLTGLDFKRWYSNFKAPIEPGKPERVRRAYKSMQLLRIVVKFGVVLNITECFRLSHVLESINFSAPSSRTAALTFKQAQDICAKAIEKGLLSIALAQAFQFELTLRQIDVIGQWEPEADPLAGGIVDRGRRWRDGLLWSHIDSRGVLLKETSKVQGVTAEHDTTAYPFLRSIIEKVPTEKRFGPVIVSEATGLPYRYRYFSKVWREIADEVGVPGNVWNRDSRAGGVTEGSDAGADLEHLRHHANHKNAQTTVKYNRKTLEKTRTVAELRVAHRAKENK